MAKIAPAVTLSDSDRIQLQQWVRAHFTPQQVALRSRILLLAAEGRENLEIAAELKVNRHTPALWRQRFIREGLDAVWERFNPDGVANPITRQARWPRLSMRPCRPNPKEPPIGVAERWRGASRSARTPSTASGRNTTSSRT